ncbi:ECF transporter S component [Bifidobacterium samirii]|uniref:ABC transporter permease n=1 Tax=Bifidobacterium samirii TaxID=2306974 RepID=A0A430FWX5_9BIFI|nr:ECF transporter S component [Bifidobacterium samirii]RSX58822.1 ABC transporter permease [Bifidobacterium samirii]
MSDRHTHSSSFDSFDSSDPSDPSASGHGAVSSAVAAEIPVRLRWTPQEIAVGAALGAACGLIFWAFNFAYMPVLSLLGAVLPGLASLVHAVWYFSGTLALLILRKPGAALYVNLVGTLVESVVGSQFAIGFVLVSALLQGVFAEIPFAITRYRRYDLPVSMISGALVALEYGVYLMLFRYQGVAFLSPRGITHMICEVIGGIAISGVMSWYLYRAIGRTGVLDRLPSGRALRAERMA